MEETAPLPQVNASRVARKLASSVSSAQSIVFHGARIALVGHVTKTLSAIVKAEEDERSALLQAFTEREKVSTSSASASSTSLTATSPISSTSAVPDALRIFLNGVRVDEHEERYEVVHEEFALHKSLFAEFLRRWGQLTEGRRASEKMSRAALEREAVMRIIEIVAHYEVQCATLVALQKTEHTRVAKIASSRGTMQRVEEEHRQTICGHESVKMKQLLREAAASVVSLREFQLLYEQEMEELRREAEAKAREAEAKAMKEFLLMEAAQQGK